MITRPENGHLERVLPKMSTLKMSTPKIYVVTKCTEYLNYIKTCQTASQMGWGSCHQYIKLTFALCVWYMGWYYARDAEMDMLDD